MANAHAVFARFCELKSIMRRSAAASEYPPQSLKVRTAKGCGKERRERKEAHEPGQVQDPKPKNIQAKFNKTYKMMPKISHNESQILSKSLLGALLGPLGRLLGPS